MAATMSVTPRPCVSLRRHGQLQVTRAGLVALGTLDQVSAGFLAAAARARCNIVVVGGVNAGKPTLQLERRSGGNVAVQWAMSGSGT